MSNKKQSVKTLKEMVKLYEMFSDISNNSALYSRSDDVVHDLESAIFTIGSFVFPDGWCSIPDLIELVKES